MAEGVIFGPMVGDGYKEDKMDSGSEKDDEPGERE